MTTPAVIVRHITVRGFVQGVGYRAWTEQTALARGLEGWVRNRRDGNVEALFAGPQEAVTGMIMACRNGPRGARVDGIAQREAAPDELRQRRPGERFSVLATV